MLSHSHNMRTVTGLDLPFFGQQKRGHPHLCHRTGLQAENINKSQAIQSIISWITVACWSCLFHLLESTGLGICSNLKQQSLPGLRYRGSQMFLTSLAFAPGIFILLYLDSENK